MDNKFITVDFYDKKYSTTVKSWGKDYDELEKSKVNEYFRQDNTDKIKILKEYKSKLDNQIKELLLLKAEQELELDFINQAEVVKQKNLKIRDYIDKLKSENKINVWIKINDSWNPGECIQNATYSFSITIHTSTCYKTNEVKYYEVKYCFSINNILGKDGYGGEVIKSIDKKFSGKEKEKMLKYVEGRKNVYAKYFIEDKPVMIKEYSQSIKMNGIVLDGYSVEE